MNIPNEKINFKSPARQSLFRSCKSPMKSSHKEEKNETKPLKPDGKVDLAIDMLNAFPQINDNFDVVKKVGEGTFSKVYLARMKDDPSRMFAFKHLVPTSSPRRIENELKCLQKLGDKCNVLGVKASLRNDDHIVFILPYFPHRKFNDTIDRLSANDIHHYLKNLFIALQHVHSHHIIHRDVKPSNFLYSKETDSYALIDFGLAMPVPGTKNSFLTDYTSTVVPTNTGKSVPNIKVPNKSSCKHPRHEVCTLCKNRPRQQAPRAGTPGFRSPEVLMRYPKQTTAVDMWSAGVILLCMLSRRYPFFKAKDDIEALSQIIALFGTKKIKKMAESIGKIFDCNPAIDNVDSLKVVCQNLSRRSCQLHRCSSQSVKRKHNETVESLSPKRRVSETNKIDFAKDDVASQRILTDITVSTMTETNCDTKLSEKKPRKRVTCTCVPDSAYDLLEKLLELQPDKRISAEDCLKHPYITQHHNP